MLAQSRKLAKRKTDHKRTVVPKQDSMGGESLLGQNEILKANLILIRVCDGFEQLTDQLMEVFLADRVIIVFAIASRLDQSSYP